MCPLIASRLLFLGDDDDELGAQGQVGKGTDSGILTQKGTTGNGPCQILPEGQTSATTHDPDLARLD
ncbi:hypothetical protein PG997_011286 [Apiospora hydei]|uniref:Uncharacterized protein n=1 Tax=Apiospora hydei TaxID=1337664 RepID=A0ABR1VIL1_9PEZI